MFSDQPSKINAKHGTGSANFIMFFSTALTSWNMIFFNVFELIFSSDVFSLVRGFSQKLSSCSSMTIQSIYLYELNHKIKSALTTLTRGIPWNRSRCTISELPQVVRMSRLHVSHQQATSNLARAINTINKLFLAHEKLYLWVICGPIINQCLYHDNQCFIEYKCLSYENQCFWYENQWFVECRWLVTSWIA